MLTGMAAESAGGTAAASSEFRPDQTAGGDVDAAYVVDETENAKTKKKRKVIKESDKKYHCPHDDCGKAYSRAEHLYRHQLNRRFRATSHGQSISPEPRSLTDV